MTFETLEWFGGVDGYLEMVDQRRLPEMFLQMCCGNTEQLWDAIKTLAVRGAPAIGVAAGYGICLAMKEVSDADIDLTADDVIDGGSTAEIKVDALVAKIDSEDAEEVAQLGVAVDGIPTNPIIGARENADSVKAIVGNHVTSPRTHAVGVARDQDSKGSIAQGSRTVDADPDEIVVRPAGIGTHLNPELVVAGNHVAALRTIAAHPAIGCRNSIELHTR